jgi:hypothetical protein
MARDTFKLVYFAAYFPLCTMGRWVNLLSRLNRQEIKCVFPKKITGTTGNV